MRNNGLSGESCSGNYRFFYYLETNTREVFRKLIIQMLAEQCFIIWYTGEYDTELLKLFNLSLNNLAEIRPSFGKFGNLRCFIGLLMAFLLLVYWGSNKLLYLDKNVCILGNKNYIWYGCLFY